MSKRDREAEKHAVQRENRIRDFLKRLAKAAPVFHWEIDRWGQLRGYEPEHAFCFCPITALLYVEKGIICRTSEVHEVAAAELGIEDLALAIVDATECPEGRGLGMDLIKAVGMKFKKAVPL